MVLFWLMVFRAVKAIRPRVVQVQYRYAKSLVLAFFCFSFFGLGSGSFLLLFVLFVHLWG